MYVNNNTAEYGVDRCRTRNLPLRHRAEDIQNTCFSVIRTWYELILVRYIHTLSAALEIHDLNTLHSILQEEQGK